GLCYAQRGDYVEAIKDLETYLRDGAAEIPKERQDEVSKELANLKPRIAHVIVKTNVPADIQVDDQTVGKSPLSEALMVNPGRRKISATTPGYVPANQIVTAAGSDELTVTMDLKEVPRASTAKNPYVGRTIISWSVVTAGVLT